MIYPMLYFRFIDGWMIGVFLILSICCILSFTRLLLEWMLALIFMHLFIYIRFLGKELRFDQIINYILELKRTCRFSHIFTTDRNMIFIYNLRFIDASEVRYIRVMLIRLQRMPKRWIMDQSFSFLKVIIHRIIRIIRNE